MTEHHLIEMDEDWSNFYFYFWKKRNFYEIYLSIFILDDELLKTIRLPKNIHYLTDRLPKANYNPLMTKKIDKNRFL